MVREHSLFGRIREIESVNGIDLYFQYCYSMLNSILQILLNLTDLQIYRSFAKPPKPVQVVCECIVVMKGIKEVSWKSAKGMMSEANFLKSLTEMDVDGITAKQVSTVKGKSL